MTHASVFSGIAATIYLLSLMIHIVKFVRMYLKLRNATKFLTKHSNIKQSDIISSIFSVLGTK